MPFLAGFCALGVLGCQPDDKSFQTRVRERRRVMAVNLGAAIHALPFRVGPFLQAYAQNNLTIVEVFLGRRRKRIDFMNDLGYKIRIAPRASLGFRRGFEHFETVFPVIGDNA